jgi:hypothetical protein
VAVDDEDVVVADRGADLKMAVVAVVVSFAVFR